MLETFQMRRWISRGALGLGVMMALEILSVIVLKLVQEWPAGSFAESYQVAQWNVAAGPGFGAWFAHLKTHPFFGFQRDKSQDSRVNNFGLMDPRDFPYIKNDDEFVIGVLGGSLAESFAFHSHNGGHFLSGLRDKIPWLKNKKIVVLGLGLAGGKQPQQFIIASYFLETVDLLVNIDGMAEIVDRDTRYPSDFPLNYHYLYGPGVLGPFERFQISTSRQLTQFLSKLPLKWPLLEKSSTFYLLWRMAARSERNRVRRMDERVNARAETRRPYFSQSRVLSREVAAQEYSEIWERYTFLEDQAARAQNRRALFFLQPNLYVQAKALSTEEKVLSSSNHPDWVEKMKYRHGILREHLNSLRARGVLAFDLTEMFSGVTDTVYVDGCCHMNNRGFEILGRQIVDAIAQHQNEIFSRGPESLRGASL